MVVKKMNKKETFNETIIFINIETIDSFGICLYKLSHHLVSKIVLFKYFKCTFECEISILINLKYIEWYYG